MADIKRNVRGNLASGKIAKQANAIELEAVTIELKDKVAARRVVAGKIATLKPNPFDPPKHTDIGRGPFHIDRYRGPEGPIYYRVGFRQTLDKNDIAILEKNNCILEGDTLYIPEARIEAVADVLKAERFTAILKK